MMVSLLKLSMKVCLWCYVMIAFEYQRKTMISAMLRNQARHSQFERAHQRDRFFVRLAILHTQYASQQAFLAADVSLSFETRITKTL